MTADPRWGLVADFHWHCEVCQSRGSGTEDQQRALLDEHLRSEGHVWRVEVADARAKAEGSVVR